jgi:pyrimidine-nucleoside phosphorylase
MVMSYSNGDLPDYQMAAFLMAVFIQGLNDDETFYFTQVMLKSGDTMDWTAINKPKADKHSTGGVGDGTSLILAPIVACCDICVPMMSGRGLGHTGGTLDKLESIPGFRVDLDNSEFFDTAERAGFALVGQTQNMAPADKKIYALRDSIAAVESIPLICASIMSKKIAEGADILVLDVKTGNGAFMATFEKSRDLARKLIAIGKKANKKMTAFITDMNTPLGYCAGNANEIKQAVEILKGEVKNDLSELSLILAAAMIQEAGKAKTFEDALALAQKQIDTGHAIEAFRKVIRLQGGNEKIVDDTSLLPLKTKHKIDIKAKTNGFISTMFTRDIGIAGVVLGAGRDKKEDKIDPAAGIYFLAKTGDEVKEGQVIARIENNDKDSLERAQLIMDNAYIISKEKPEPVPLVKEIIK